MDSGPVGSFLETLQREGDFDSIGRFTLDASKAREKLREYQLEDPHSYGVHLVAAAVASDATLIQIHNDADDLKLIFDGRPFTVEELSQLFNAPFSSDRDEALIRLRELAIGINNALRFKPRWIDVESQGAHLRVYLHSERLERLRPRAGASSNTTIHVRERTGLRVALRFVSHLSRRRPLLPEGEAIAGQCLYSPVPLLLNRQAVNRPVPVGQGLVLTCLGGVEPPDNWPGLVIREELEGAFQGYLVLDLRADRSMHWIVNGVHHAETLESPRAASVWLVANHLRKDLSQRSIDHNDDWRAVLQALQPVRLRQEQALARGYPELPESLQSAARTFLLEAIASHFDVRKPWEPKHDPLADCPLFPLAQGGQVSLRALLDQSHQRGVELCWVTDRAWRLPPLDGTLVVRADSTVHYCLSVVFQAVPPGDYLLEAAAQAAANQLVFENSQPQYPRFHDDEQVLLSLPLEGEGFQGLLALSSLQRWPALPKARMRCFKGGRLLGERPLPEGSLPDGVSVLVDSPELAPNADWSGVAPHQPLLLVVDVAVEAHIPELFLAAAQDLDGTDGRLRRDAVLAWLAYHGPGTGLEDVPILGGASYNQLLEQQERLGHTPVTDRHWSSEADRAVRVSAVPALELQECLVLCLDSWLKPKAEKLFSPRLAYDRQLERLEKYRRAQQRWLEQPQVPCRLPNGPTYLARLPLQGCEGEVALAASAATAVPVHFYREGRSLGVRYVNYESRALGGLPAGLQAAIRQDDFQPHPDWSMVEAGPSLSRALALLSEHVEPLYEKLWESFPLYLPARRWAQTALASYLEWRGPGLEGLSPRLLEAASLDGLGENRHTLQELLDEIAVHGQARVLVNETQLEGEETAGPPFFRVGPDLFRALEGWLGLGTLLDAQEDYLLGLCARDFERRPMEALELSGEVQLRAPLEGWPGELALVSDPDLMADHLHVRVLHGGRWLADWDLYLGGATPTLTPAASRGNWRAVAVVEAGSLPARPDWSDLAENKGRRALEKALRLAARRLGLALLERKETPEALTYLWNQLACEFAEGPSSRLDAVRRELLEAPLFPTATGSWCSLSRLFQEIEEGGRVGYLSSRPDPVPEKEPIVVVRRDMLPVFRGILGVEHTADAGRAVKARVRAAQAEPVERLELPEREYLAVGVLGSSREGRVGLCAELARGSRLQLFVKRRPLGERRLSWPFVVEAVVDDPSLRANLDWTGPADGAELESALRAVKECAVQLVMGLVHGWRGDPESQRPAVRRYLVELACRCEGLEPALQSVLWSLPLFADAGGARVSLRHVVSAGRVLSLPPEPQEGLEELLPPDTLTLLLEPWEAEQLARRRPLEDYREALAAARSLRAQPVSLDRPDFQRCLAVWELEAPRLGRLGWFPASQELELVMFWQGRLARRYVSAGYPGGVAVIDHPEAHLPDRVLEQLAGELSQELRRRIQRQLDRVDWLPLAESRRLWLELAERLQLGEKGGDTLEVQLLTRRRFQSVGGAPRSLEEIRTLRPPWALPGESVPLRVPPVLVSSVEEAELLQRVVGPLPRVAPVQSDRAEWLAEIDLQLPGFSGRLAVEREPGLNPDVELRDQGIRVELTPGVTGWVEGPLAGPEQARRLLENPVRELLLKLVREAPDAPERVLEVLSRYLPWHRAAGLPAEVLSARLFPRRDGQRFPLAELLEQDSLLFAPPQDLEAPEGSLVLHPPELVWLSDLRPGREPRLWNKRADERPEAQPARLLEELRSLGVPAYRLELTEEGLCSWAEGEVRINRAHPLWQRLLLEPRGSARYYLLSALAAQASPEGRRELHRRLLEMLEG